MYNIKRNDFPFLSDEQFRIIVRQFCGGLTKLGKCTPYACIRCQVDIRHILSQVESVRNARNYDALFTWFAQERVAEIAEEAEEQKSHPLNRWGEILTDNPFELLLKTIK